jgi:hypothetical protein
MKREKMADTELRKFFNFQESDLTANQMGRISANQMKRIREEEKSTSKTFRNMGIGLILINLCIIIGFILNVTGDGFSFATASRDDIIGMTAMMVVPTIIIGLFVWLMFWLASSKLDYSVQKIEGNVRLVKVEKSQSYKTASGSTSQRTVQQYELRVGKVKFEDVDGELINILEEGDLYAFYYTKDAKAILSCELIAKKK